MNRENEGCCCLCGLVADRDEYDFYTYQSTDICKQCAENYFCIETAEEFLMEEDHGDSLLRSFVAGDDSGSLFLKILKLGNSLEECDRAEHLKLTEQWYREFIVDYNIDDFAEWIIRKETNK